MFTPICSVITSPLWMPNMPMWNRSTNSSLCTSKQHQLVGGFNHLEKYESVNGKDDIPYIMENNPFMFQTTNQSKSWGLMDAHPPQKMGSQRGQLDPSPYFSLKLAHDRWPRKLNGFSKASANELVVELPVIITILIGKPSISMGHLYHGYVK